MIVAADLRPSNVGEEIAFVLDEPVHGRLDAVDHVSEQARTKVTVDGVEHLLWPDCLVAFLNPDVELAILAEPGRDHVWTRARRAADRLLLSERRP